MKSLRDLAESDGRLDSTKIGRLLDKHPDRADEIRDLLLGEPWIPHATVARTLCSAFPDDEPIRQTDVSYWRSVH